MLTIDDCIAAVERVFRDLGEGRIAPPKSLGIHAEHGTFHIKAAIGEVFVAKINANFPGTRPMIKGVIAVFDIHDGTPLGILDSAPITTLRTAAATAVAAKYLARKDAKSLAIIGYGTQGRAHVDALRRVRDIETVTTYDIGDSIDGIDADIIVTCTPSKTPILDARHLRPGMFIAGVGADNPEKHELSPALLKESRVVADILEQAAMGDLHHAIEAGVMTRDDVAGELSDVVLGRVGRQSEDEIIVFDSTGTALQDLVAAQLVIAEQNALTPPT
jgi:alanine dehydrogenase